MEDRIANAHYTTPPLRARTPSPTPAGRELDEGVPDRLGERPERQAAPENITNPEFREAGFGIVNTNEQGARSEGHHAGLRQPRRAKPMLLGVVYNDSVKADHMYQAGEGVGDVTST